MRNAWRVLVFDILAPLAVLASLVYIGLALERPLQPAAGPAPDRSGKPAGRRRRPARDQADVTH